MRLDVIVGPLIIQQHFTHPVFGETLVNKVVTRLAVERFQMISFLDGAYELLLLILLASVLVVFVVTGRAFRPVTIRAFSLIVAFLVALVVSVEVELAYCCQRIRVQNSLELILESIARCLRDVRAVRELGIRMQLLRILVIVAII